MNDVTEISVAFDNLAQATAEDRADVTNLMMTNSTLREQVAMCANHLSIKEADNMALQMAVSNLRGELKNLKVEIQNLKKSGHSGVAGAAYKNNGRMVPSWKREVQSHHPTWWSTTYC